MGDRESDSVKTCRSRTLYVVSRSLGQSLLISDAIVLTVIDIADDVLTLAMTTGPGDGRQLEVRRDVFTAICPSVSVTFLPFQVRMARLGFKLTGQVAIQLMTGLDLSATKRVDKPPRL